MRHPITAQYYPQKITVEQFVALLSNDGMLFFTNLNTDPRLLYPEEWLEIFARWMELRLGDDNEGTVS